MINIDKNIPVCVAKSGPPEGEILYPGALAAKSPVDPKSIPAAATVAKFLSFSLSLALPQPEVYDLNGE